MFIMVGRNHSLYLSYFLGYLSYFLGDISPFLGDTSFIFWDTSLIFRRGPLSFSERYLSSWGDTSFGMRYRIVHGEGSRM